MDGLTENADEVEILRPRTTIIIIAHRYSMVHDADFAIVMSEGKISEYGTPAELIKQKGWFADFANAAINANEGQASEKESEKKVNEE